MRPVLEVTDLTLDFGGVRALNDVDLNIGEGEIVALIGPNGAGKSTLFNCISGIYQPTEGTIFLTVDRRTHNLVGKKAHEITALGIARTFQNIHLFGQMTVLENVLTGRYCRTKAGFLQALVRNAKTMREAQDSVDISYGFLKLIGLQDKWNETAQNLPYGAQRRLEIARALASEPRLLLLDEPAAGMNPHETREIQELILKLRDEHNLSIMLIEHDMRMVMSLPDRIYVMEYGSHIASGTPTEIRSNPDVIKAYLEGNHDA